MKRGLIAGAAALLLVSGAAAWIWMARSGGRGEGPAGVTGESTSTERPVTSPSAGSPLGARLAIVTGAPGDDVLAVVRIFNARARQPAPIGDATPVKVDVSQSALAPTLRLELENDSGPPQTVSSAILRLPEPSQLVLGTSPSAVVHLEIAAGDRPAVGRRVRAVMELNGARIETNWAPIEPEPPDRAGQLVARAYRQQMIDPAGAELADTAAALTNEMPADPRGHWYTGISREARGDGPGALAAYRATADRLIPGDEPPIGLYMRIARLER